MSEIKYKGRYVATAIWAITSILFFNHVSFDWMKIWLKITLGILQLAALSFITYNLYKHHSPQFKRVLVGMCLDLAITIPVLIFFCSR